MKVKDCVADCNWHDHAVQWAALKAPKSKEKGEKTEKGKKTEKEKKEIETENNLSMCLLWRKKAAQS